MMCLPLLLVAPCPDCIGVIGICIAEDLEALGWCDDDADWCIWGIALPEPEVPAASV